MIRAEIVNKGGVPLDFIEAEIADVEKAHGRKVRKAEFVRIGEDNVRERFWWEPVDFERIRRITGYLVGTLDRFNDGKRAEEHDRVKHS